MMKQKMATAIAVLAMLQANVAHAAETAPKCLSTVQAEALIMYLLPKAVDASRDRCAAVLPIDSALMAENSNRLEEYDAASESAWPQAREALAVISDDKVPAELDDRLVRPIADLIATTMIGDAINPRDCRVIDKIYGDLEPMPSRNLASLAVTIIQVSTKDDANTDIPICKAPET